jgi:predicted nucleotidyltransferase
MNEATRWRFALAEQIGAAYAANHNAEVVMIAGSVARGSADRYSDIEVDVYYAEPPTEAERIAAVERCGGTVELLAEDEDEWEEQMSIGGFHAHTSTFLVATMERYLREVIEQCSLAPEAQTRLFSLQHGITVKGESQVERWRAKAAAYPDGLQRAMLEENLRFGQFRHAAEMLAARDDLLALYDVFVETGRQLMGALLGLNRIYMPTPGYLKSMDETIALMAVKPADLAARLKRSFQTEPTPAVDELEALIEETLALVEAHVPGFDTAPIRTNRAGRRTAYDTPPARPA